MEIETHHHVESHDSFGRLIGIQTALLAMVLSVFTILSHQANTESIILVNESSNHWSHYQAKRIRDSQLELNVRLLQLMALNNDQTKKTIIDYTHQSNKYQKELAEIKDKAEKTEADAKLQHHKTAYFEFAEGLLEISMILSSLYFLSRKKLFPVIGLFLGIIGALIGIAGLFLHS